MQSKNENETVNENVNVNENENVNVNENENVNVNENENVNVNENNLFEEKNKNYDELEKLRKTIENLNTSHHLEIAKIFKLNNIKLTENNNGIFINLNKIPLSIIKEIKNYMEFIKTQENLIKIDESKKETLENIYFKDKQESVDECEI